MPAAPLKFAYWVPNAGGGLVTSRIEQRDDWDYAYNRELALLAENYGFEDALSQVRGPRSRGRGSDRPRARMTVPAHA
jgi:FMNH2-dependent dimethyl sulfone monooxygenase